MCDHVSWINHKGQCLHLDDATVFSKDGNALRKDKVQDNDFLGHGAIRIIYDLKDEEGAEGEERKFWLIDRLPEELRPKFVDFETWKQNFGRMMERYAQPDDLDFVWRNAHQNDPRWRGLSEFARETLLQKRRPIVDALKKSARFQEFPLGSDDGSSLVQLRTAGAYGWEDQNISDSNFPNQNLPASTRAFLLDFRMDMVESWDAHLAMEELGYRPGNSRETLRFGKDHPNIQREVWVVGLGDEWRDSCGDRRVVCLGGDAGGRSAGLRYRQRRWGRGCRFLAFRKESSGT